MTNSRRGAILITVRTEQAGGMQLEAVCGQRVREQGNQLVAEYAGVQYYFCSLGCLARFDSQPDLFTCQPGEGKLANRDRYLLPGHGASIPRPGPYAILESAYSDAGPG